MSKDCTPSSSFRRRLVHKNNRSLRSTSPGFLIFRSLRSTKAVSLRSPQLRSSWIKNLSFALLSIKTKTHKSTSLRSTSPVLLIVWVITHGSNKTGIIGCLGRSSGVSFSGSELTGLAYCLLTGVSCADKLYYMIYKAIVKLNRFSANKCRLNIIKYYEHYMY